MNNRYLSMLLDEQLKNLAQQSDGGWPQQKVLPRLVRARPFGQQVLQMQGRFALFRLAISGHNQRFGTAFAPIQANLEQLVHPTAVREGNGSQSRAVQAAPVELFRSKDQLAWLYAESDTS